MIKNYNKKTRIKLFTGYDTDMINLDLDNFFNKNPMIEIVDIKSNLQNEYKLITVIYNILVEETVEMIHRPDENCEGECDTCEFVDRCIASSTFESL